MTPENGARISVFASRAAASATAASATLRLFSASSFACPEMKPCFCRSIARSYLALASVRFAFACCTSASLIAGSSLTSVAPLATGLALLKSDRIDATRDFRAQGDRFVGAQAADRRDGLRHRRRRGGDGFHHDRRSGAAGTLVRRARYLRFPPATTCRTPPALRRAAAPASTRLPRRRRHRPRRPRRQSICSFLANVTEFGPRTSKEIIMRRSRAARQTRPLETSASKTHVRL